MQNPVHFFDSCEQLMTCDGGTIRDAIRIVTSATEQAAEDPFPVDGIAALRETGLLTATLDDRAGRSPTGLPLREALMAIGRVSLPLGRIYEGHTNALDLVLRYARGAAREGLIADARAGHLFGVWNTGPHPGGLSGRREGEALNLSGAKTFASGAGFVTRPLVTVRLEDGRSQMAVATLAEGTRADLSEWRVHGMRASASGRVDFTGLRILPHGVVGEPDDYFRQPVLSCGAWRFLAVQCGGIEAVFDAHRTHLLRTGRGDDPHQRARFGLSATALETARLFTAKAARLASRSDVDPEGAVAFVNLARGAVERAGLDVIELAQRSVGLAGFLQSHPLERIMRDLATYLRQPMPDVALASAAGHLLAMPGPSGDVGARV